MDVKIVLTTTTGSSNNIAHPDELFHGQEEPGIMNI